MNLFYLLWTESDTFFLSFNFIWVLTILILHSLFTSVLVTFLCFYLSHIRVHCIQKIQTLKKSVVWKVGESRFFSFKTLEKTSWGLYYSEQFQILWGHCLTTSQLLYSSPSRKPYRSPHRRSWDVVARWDDIPHHGWLVLARSILFILFLHFASLSIYWVPNVDLRLECSKYISCFLFGVRALPIFREKGKPCCQDRTSFQHWYKIEHSSIRPFPECVRLYCKHGDGEIFNAWLLFQRISLTNWKDRHVKVQCKVPTKRSTQDVHGRIFPSTHFCEMLQRVLNIWFHVVMALWYLQVEEADLWSFKPFISKLRASQTDGSVWALGLRCWVLGRERMSLAPFMPVAIRVTSLCWPWLNFWVCGP